MRKRTKTIKDLILNERDFKLLKNGYRIFKQRDGASFCIYLDTPNRRTLRRIERLKDKIKRLQEQLKGGKYAKEEK